MKIESTYVTFEQGKILDNKIISKKVYDNGKLKNKPSFSMSSIHDYGGKVLYAPEQWQVVEWLRLKYGMWIQPIYQINSYWGFDIQKLDPKSILSGSTWAHMGKFKSPQEAYSAAFDYIFKNNLI